MRSFLAGWAAAAGVAAVCSCAAAELTEKVVNPLGRAVESEPVRLRMELPAGVEPKAWSCLEDGRRVAWQRYADAGGKARAWVAVSLPAASRGAALPARTYTFVAGTGPAFAPAVRVIREGDAIVLDNGHVAVRVPARAGGGAAPCPLLGVRLPDGAWVGKGQWQTAMALRALNAEVVGDGTVHGAVRLTYAFEGKAGLDGVTEAFAVVEVSLFPGQKHVVIDERHAMGRGDHWEFDAASGWSPGTVECRVFSGGAGKASDPSKWPRTLEPGGTTTEALLARYEAGETRIGDTLIQLIPRWSQHYEFGWFFGVADGKSSVGAMVCRAGRWDWPHNNMVSVKARPTADYAGFRCPTWRGARYWFLTVGGAGEFAMVDAGTGAKPVDRVAQYVQRYAFEPLDKLHNDYILEWPGNEGVFSGEFFFSDGVNPTGMWRQMGRNAVKEAGKPGGYNELIKAQVMLDPDMYGRYWNRWSPENPNFFTDFMKRPIALVTRLKAHPRFEELRRKAELALREDLYHSVTLPGGAGQECPGYSNHGLGAWRDMAPMCREHLGFDPTVWPQYAAIGDFLLHASAPAGAGKRLSHPGGDTHPPGPAISGDVKGFVSEELPGFGVVLRNGPGTERETYAAFKSGPNRGHYHGDQLSLHYAANARLLAVDHHCGYKPRAGQEHMHNRVAFHTAGLPYANMDGYERVLALKTSPGADVAVGQVESERLRYVTALPPETWDQRYPQEELGGILTYRRTVVLVKGGAADYLVVRDQYESPRDIGASYCLHVLGGRAENDGPRTVFDGLTLYCATPAKADFGRYDWQHENGGLEATKGVRLTQQGRSGEFVTVLYPSATVPAMAAIPGGVRVGDDEVVFGGGLAKAGAAERVVTVRRGAAELLSLSGGEISLERSQGQIGLFVPDCGYPFGEIPDWLIKQRAALPEWARP